MKYNEQMSVPHLHILAGWELQVFSTMAKMGQLSTDQGTNELK